MSGWVAGTLGVFLGGLRGGMLTLGERGNPAQCVKRQGISCGHGCCTVQYVHGHFNQGGQEIDRSLRDAARGEWLNMSAWSLHGICAAGSEWDLVLEQGLRIARTN